MSMRNPKWVTPTRQNHLVTLFTRSGGFCVFGHKPCSIPEHHYEVFIEYLIDDWKADDRAQRAADWKAVQRQIHSLGERKYPLHGEFNNIGMDVFYASQPQYYYIGLGISGLTFKPFAEVRLSSSYVKLHVDIGKALKGLSKSKKRKTIRYGIPLPDGVHNNIIQVCNLAVRHYLEQ